MLLNFIKLLIDTPEKLTHALISCTKYIFSFLFAIVLFHNLAGNHWPEAPQWNANWVDLLLKKQILLYIFFYVLSYILLFEVFQAIYVFLLHIIPKHIRFKKIDNNVSIPILFTLKGFDILQEDKQTRRPKAAKNTEQLHELLKSLVSEDDSAISSPSTHPLIYDLPYCYTLFVIYYFFNSDLPSHAALFDTLLVIGVFALPLALMKVKKLYEFLQDHATSLLLYTEALIAERDIEKNLRDRRMTPGSRPSKQGNQPEAFFVCQGQEYVYHILYTDGAITELLLLSFIHKVTHDHLKIVIFTNSLLDEEALAKIEELRGQLFLIHFKDIPAIPQVIKESLKVNIPPNVIL